MLYGLCNFAVLGAVKLLKEKKSAWIMLIVITFLGCNSMTPHENFKAQLNNKIGKKWNELPYFQFPSEKYLISTKILTNGNLEKRYRSRKKCIHIYEIDPKTNIIVNASFEGSETDCAINP